MTGPKAPEKEAGEALRGTVEQELHYELVEDRAKSKLRQSPGGRNRRMGKKRLNHSNGEGPPTLGPWCLLLKASFQSLSCLSAPGDEAQLRTPPKLSQAQQNSEEQEPQEWAQGAETSEPTHWPSLSCTGRAEAGIRAASSSTRPRRPQEAEAAGS